MKKAVSTIALCVVLAAGLACAGCGGSGTWVVEDSEEYYELSDDELSELAGTEIDATVTEAYETTTQYTGDEAEYDTLGISVEFPYTTADGDEETVLFDWSWDLKDVEGFDSVEEYANSVTSFAHADGSEASLTEVAGGDSVTIVFDEEGLLTSLVIND